ncbi:DUF4209 domain-containing protein [Campylobacter sp. RM16191]|uniref:DUF4209 domain-containing protein n=1 Tax=Campylobacter sp. RM16191 TaxID=1705728 RepID=UPI0014732909|nr:DUF4209 domain-containing protein [Campylobacter sp. RM16191]
MNIEIFNSLGIDKILYDVSEFDDYCFKFKEVADLELKNGNQEKAKILSLLSSITSLCLQPDSWNEPFTPFYLFEKSRSAIVDDFSDDDLKTFSDILDHINDCRLKARIADVLWFVKRDVKFLLLAIESYIKLPFRFHPFELNCYKRAINLSLNTKQKRYLDELKIKLLDKFYNCTVDDKRCCADIADLLSLLKIDSDDAEKIFEKLENFATKYRESKDFLLSVMYYDEAKKWCKKIKNADDKLIQLTLDKSDLFCFEARDANGGIIKKICLENALEELRTIPKKDRAKINVGNRIDKIYEEIAICNSSVRDELQLIQTEPIDISEYQKQSIDLVANKDLNEAILAFTRVTPYQSYDVNKKLAQDSIRKFPLHSIFNSIFIADDGRSIAKASKEYECLNAEICKYYDIGITVSVDGAIFPAFDKLLEEHRISKRFIYGICANSSIVPKDRILLWSQGLFYGFEREFIVSSHILIPQLENLIRVLLKQENIKTTIIDDGIETEKSINALLENNELCNVIPKNLIEIFKILLTNPTGFNHRNNIVHGLLNDDSFVSYADIYIWWLCLSLVVNSSHLRVALDNKAKSTQN